MGRRALDRRGFGEETGVVEVPVLPASPPVISQGVAGFFTSWQVSRVVSAEEKADHASRIVIDRRPNVVAGQRGVWFAHGEIPRLLGKEGISRAVEGPGRAS